ncbi:hypothetical protein SDC9_133134 [bioreactor metagenome]|uniref:Uncharacterized protein n=1 Tax=bioreactor metagenome TaxID=1076179 RepID=A0A645D9U9_9ZZZZ
MKEGVGVDQYHSILVSLQALQQGHMLGAEMIAMGGPPRLQRLAADRGDSDGQCGIGSRVVGQDFDRDVRPGCGAKPGQGAGNAEKGFLVVGFCTVDDVEQSVHGVGGSGRRSASVPRGRTVTVGRGEQASSVNPRGFVCVAQQMLHVARTLDTAKWALLGAHVRHVDQPQSSVRGEHDIAQVQRTEVDPKVVKSGDERAQHVAQLVRLIEGEGRA